MGAAGKVGAARESFVRRWLAPADRLAEAIYGLHEQQIAPAMDLRIYQLTTVRPPAAVAGRMRQATDADRPLLDAWFAAFHGEATPGAAASDTATLVTRWLTSPSRYLALWEDGEPVSLAGATGPTPNGIRSRSRADHLRRPSPRRTFGVTVLATAVVLQLALIAAWLTLGQDG